jgi:ribosomal protein S18 acetylase RimI-like enzyme
MSVVELPKLRIEPLAEQDLDQAAVFLLKQWRETYRARLPRSLIDARSSGHFRDALSARLPHCRLAWMGSRLAGLVSTQQNCIEDLWVAKRYRRRGIGTQLTAVAVEGLRTRDYQFAQVGCEDFNADAIAFFSKSGWRHIGGEPVQVAPGMQVEALVFSFRLDAVAPVSAVESDV